MYATPTKMLEHQNLQTQDVALEVPEGMECPPNYTAMTTEADNGHIGLMDHDYGVVEYPSPTVVPEEPTGDFEEMMVQEFSAETELVEEELFNIEDVFGSKGAVATEVEVETQEEPEPQPTEPLTKSQLKGITCMFCKVGQKAKSAKSKGRWLRCGNVNCHLS